MIRDKASSSTSTLLACKWKYLKFVDCYSLELNLTLIGLDDLASMSNILTGKYFDIWLHVNGGVVPPLKLLGV